MEERLNELVKILKERDTVRKILQAKDVKSVYEEEKATVTEKIEAFHQYMQSFIGEIGFPIPNNSKVICPENVVEICFILLMSRIDDIDLVGDDEVIHSALNQVKGDLKEISKSFSVFLVNDFLSEYSEEELLKKIVL